MNILYLHSGKAMLTGGGTYRDAVIGAIGRNHSIGDTYSPNWQSMNWDLAHATNLMDVNPSVLEMMHCPIIIDVHDYYWTRFYPFWAPDLPLRFVAQRIRKRKYLKIISLADAVITHSRYVFERISCPLKFNVPYGFATGETQERVAWRNRENMILFVGGNYFRKGLHVLLKALPLILESVPDAKLVVAGSERQHTLWAAKWLARGLPVTFLGGLPRAEVMRLYQQARVYVLPSEIEATAITFNEAMANGTPIVASAVGAIPEVVTDQVTGFLFKRGDFGTLADRIVTCLRDEQVASRLIANGLEESKKRTLDQMINAIESVYQEVMNA